MRKRTGKEKEAMGLLDPIFRDLAIKKATRGYMPLMDLICYAYANPNKKFLEIMDILSKENFYVGVRKAKKPEEVKVKLQQAHENAMKVALTAGKSLEEAEELAKAAEEKIKIALAEEANFSLIPSMERTIETALEGTAQEVLNKYELTKLSVLVQSRNAIEQEEMEGKLLEELGEKYNEYDTHEERVIVFFARKLLKYIQGPASN